MSEKTRRALLACRDAQIHMAGGPAPDPESPRRARASEGQQARLAEIRINYYAEPGKCKIYDPGGRDHQGACPRHIGTTTKWGPFCRAHLKFLRRIGFLETPESWLSLQMLAPSRLKRSA